MTLTFDLLEIFFTSLILVHWLVPLMILNIIRTKMAKCDPKFSIKFRNKYLRCKNNETYKITIFHNYTKAFSVNGIFLIMFLIFCRLLIMYTVLCYRFYVHNLNGDYLLQ